MSVRVIAGQAKGRPLRRPRTSAVRPTTDLVRGALFSALAQSVSGARVLDLFAGTGALGIEALSRGAASAHFVESDSRQCADIRSSLRDLAYADHAAVHRAKVERAILSMPGPYDLIFLDPPYAYPNLGELLETIAGSPLVGPDTIVAVEHSKRQPLADTYGGLTRGKHRTYGETCTSLYRPGGSPW